MPNQKDVLNYYMNLKYEIDLKHYVVEGTAFYVATHPELPGCIAQGFTVDEAQAYLIDAKLEYIKRSLENGDVVPLPVGVPQASWWGKTWWNDEAK